MGVGGRGEWGGGGGVSGGREWGEETDGNILLRRYVYCVTVGCCNTAVGDLVLFLTGSGSDFAKNYAYQIRILSKGLKHN